ncbi:uncharacterized protein [Typha angustifolia]|uniref:uncharacterized protein n=1 Tax=Typha angustifolia TaxID=59011 RepID=UPI003C2AFCD6
MDLALALALALFAALAIASSVAQNPPPQPPALPIDCPFQLVAMSACLPYVAAPPNVPTFAPSVACCAAFLRGGDGACFCHLVRDPLLLGFPIDVSRVVSLFYSCRAPNASAAADSFVKICRESQSLPPLRSVTPTGADKLSPASPEAPVLPDPGQPSTPKESNTTTRSPFRSRYPLSDASAQSPVSGGGGFLFVWRLMIVVFFLACL